MSAVSPADLIIAADSQGKTFFSQPMEEKERYLAGSSGAGYTKLLTQALGEGKRDHKGASTVQDIPAL